MIYDSAPYDIYHVCAFGVYPTIWIDDGTYQCIEGNERFQSRVTRLVGGGAFSSNVFRIVYLSASNAFSVLGYRKIYLEI